MTTTRMAAILLAIGGLLLGVGGELHPRADTALAYEGALSGMMEDAAWGPSHGFALAGTLLLAVAFSTLLRDLGADWSPRLRLLAKVTVGAVVLSAIELVPHLLASSEAAEVAAGASTPLTDLHAALQAVSTPAMGLAIGALAVVSARERQLGSLPALSVLAVLGGVLFGLAGPVMAITHDPGLSFLFAGAIGMALWVVVSGVRLSRQLAAERRPAVTSA